ncbi:MAG: SDR family NAD(P)-dependent oxidoreductase [Chloroflexi bacterium]|nr:SDR family NAD(P)-dependent oxidoreductase [Chloroflexota bacterium]
MSATPSVPVDTPLLTRPRAVIVGASSGIGAALAHKLAQEGYLVALLARNQDNLESIAQQINHTAGETQAFVYPHDVTDYDLIPSLFQTILRDLKKIDALVYVSGAQFPVGISEFEFEKDRNMLEVNLLGAVAWLGQAAVLFERMGVGQIVGISSVAADRGRVGNPAYNSSKAGLSTYLEALRNRLTRHGVNVLTVKPGFVDTKLFRENAKASFGVISPEKAANAIWRAMRKRKQQIYTPGWWRWMMLVIRHVPSIIFRRLSF